MDTLGFGLLHVKSLMGHSGMGSISLSCVLSGFTSFLRVAVLAGLSLLTLLVLRGYDTVDIIVQTLAIGHGLLLRLEDLA